MILTIGNIKGGVGKTTLAVNVAVVRAAAGRDVLLVDGDEQGTAMTFTELRSGRTGGAGYAAVALKGAAVRTQVRQLQSKYEDIVIDVGGRDTGSLRAALTVSDVALIPVQPRSFDVWAVDQMAELAKEAREINPDLRALVVLNSADAQGRDNEDAAAALREAHGLDLLAPSIGRRKAFPNAAAHGMSVSELVPQDRKAVAELVAVMAEIYAI